MRSGTTVFFFYRKTKNLGLQLLIPGSVGDKVGSDQILNGFLETLRAVQLEGLRDHLLCTISEFLAVPVLQGKCQAKELQHDEDRRDRRDRGGEGGEGGGYQRPTKIVENTLDSNDNINNEQHKQRAHKQRQHKHA